MSEPVDTPGVPPAESAASPDRIEDSSTSPEPSMAIPKPSFAERLLDALLPFRLGSHRREYRALLEQIARIEREIGRIERLRRTLTGPEAGFTPSEQSMILLRSSLTGDDLATKREQLEALKARAADLATRYPSLAWR